MIGILGFNDLHLMQFLYKYTNVLDKKGVQYEVVYWNRSLKDEDTGFQGKSIHFDYFTDTESNFSSKIGGFLRYANFMHRIIKERKYDKLIILTSQTAVPLFDLLLHRYTGKYIYDYRDITKELKSKAYKKLVKKLFDHAYCVMMSSKGFLKALNFEDSDKIVMAYNTREVLENSRVKISKTKSRKPIRIVYWGKVRQVEYNCRICDIFGNDNRFTLVYHGVGQHELLKEYCKKCGYDNISFTGYYPLTSLDDFAKETDILSCLYENDEITRFTLAVKLNDAIKYRLPLLVTKDSYLSEFVTNVCGMYSVDVGEKEKIADEIYKWYSEFDEDQAEMDYTQLQKQIYIADKRFREEVIRFCCER